MMPPAAMTFEPWVLLAMAATFVAVVLLVFGMLEYLSKGLRSYEEKYVVGATRTLDAMYLTMTPQQVLYLSLLSTLVVAILVGVTTLNAVLAIVLGMAAFIAPTVVIRMNQTANFFSLR